MAGSYNDRIPDEAVRAMQPALQRGFTSAEERDRIVRECLGHALREIERGLGSGA